MTTNTDTVGFLMDYESGNLSEDEIVEGFQHLVDTGIVWQLQGIYARTAVSLIDAGLISLADAAEPEPEVDPGLAEYHANHRHTDRPSLSEHLAGLAF